MKIKKNDTVMIIAGNAKGKTGKVLKVYPSENKLIVEGVNIKKRHTKPNQKNQQGGIVEKEAPINASNVMIIDPKTNETTRIGAKVIIDEKTSKKKIVRISRKSGEML
ncbi:MAG: 50S ribosomal protein L24 [Ignavibacteriales bacterium CG_4_9_14_3_um_filter_34_10]|nr:MAG: 50S ribosomal protein L24 [Ignavibacteriales bacterium CG_4_9_14_3_um_filter_34_10]